MKLMFHEKLRHVEIDLNTHPNPDYDQLRYLWVHFDKHDFRKIIKNHPCWNFNWTTLTPSTIQLQEFMDDHMNCLDAQCDPNNYHFRCLRQRKKFQNPSNYGSRIRDQPLSDLEVLELSKNNRKYAHRIVSFCPKYAYDAMIRKQKSRGKDFSFWTGKKTSSNKKSSSQILPKSTLLVENAWNFKSNYSDLNKKLKNLKIQQDKDEKRGSAIIDSIVNKEAKPKSGLRKSSKKKNQKNIKPSYIATSTDPYESKYSDSDDELISRSSSFKVDANLCYKSHLKSYVRDGIRHVHENVRDLDNAIDDLFELTDIEDRQSGDVSDETAEKVDNQNYEEATESNNEYQPSVSGNDSQNEEHENDDDRSYSENDDDNVEYEDNSDGYDEDEEYDYDETEYHEEYDDDEN